MAADALGPDLELEVAPAVLGGDTVVGSDRPGRRTHGIKQAGWYGLLGGLSLIVLFPIWMTLVRALSTPIAYIDAGQPVTPVEPQWDVFSRAWTEGDLAQKFAITIVVTVIIAVAQVVTVAAGRLRLRVPALPAAGAAVRAVHGHADAAHRGHAARQRRDHPQPRTGSTRFQGLTAPFLATAFGTFLIRQGFLGIPMDLRDAAELDGFGHLGFLRRVAIPVTRPIIASFTLIAFLAAWNQYTWPRVGGHRSRTGRRSRSPSRALAARNIDQLNIGFAAAIIAAVPILILLLAFQKQLVRGLTAGAVKG